MLSACTNDSGTDNQRPEAIIDIDATSGGAPLTVTVDGSQSMDSDGSIASYTWRFGDDDAQTQGVTATHTFTEAGTYTVTLTVSDDQGATDSEQLTVTVLPNNQAPTANFTASVETGDVPLSVRFDASTSTDADGIITSYTWDFGDGSSATGVTADHTFTASGSYQVTLTVTDNSGATSETQTTINVIAPNQPPTAVLTADPLTGAAPLEVTFDATSSTDTDGIITSYLWDFGDGAEGEGASVTHTYQDAGTYMVTLTLQDDAGATTTETTTITVNEPNQVPTAAFTLAPVANVLKGVVYVVIPLGAETIIVQFDASTSSDPDGDDLSYVWDFGDGSTGEGMQTGHVYEEQDTIITVTLTVTDARGASNESSIQLSVTKRALPPSPIEPNQVPTAAFTLSPVVGVFKDVIYVSIPLGAETITVHFDASTSSDPDGDDLSYAWDFGDGSTGEGMQTSHVYEQHDAHLTVTLTVTDTRGASNESSIQLSVARVSPPFDCCESNQVPTARFSMSPISSIIDDLTFFAAPIGATSMAITFDASASSDPDNDTLTYFWDFADGSTGKGKIVTHTYTFTDWPIVVSLTVTDAKGASDTAEARIHVGPTVTPP